MSWFQLDAESIVRRAKASGKPSKVPVLGGSLLHGVIGFTVLSIAGFAPWAVSGRWFYRNVGEAGLYFVCAGIFIVLSGPLLYGLMIRPGNLAPFYKIFGSAFSVYSVLWITGWMALRGHPGSVLGLLAGTAGMGLILARAFDFKNALHLIAVLFVLNSIGYFIGGVVEGAVIKMETLHLLGTTMSKRTQAIVAKSLWGVFYGVGFGAGLGLAFYLCQARARALLKIASD